MGQTTETAKFMQARELLRLPTRGFDPGAETHDVLHPGLSQKSVAGVGYRPSRCRGRWMIEFRMKATQAQV